MKIRSARFNVGQLIHHRMFDYRGVVVDVDPVFLGTDEWYERVALSRPARDRPWYHVLVHHATHMTYVAERNLRPDDSGEPIDHPLIDDYFDEFSNGAYHRRESGN